jgi:outer membrane immunogenic protein
MASMGVIRRFGLVVAVAGMLALEAGGASADGELVGVTDVQHATDWSGFYIGGQLGGAWSSVDWNFTNANYFNTVGAVLLGNSAGFDSSGALGGFLGGYNQQVGRWVFGVELAATATDLKDSHVSPLFPATDDFTSEITWIATLEGRIGYSWDRWLVYGSGGWAGADTTVKLRDRVALVVAQKDEWAQGWTIGGGAEYMLWQGIALGLEYDYTTLNHTGETVTCPGCGTGVGFGAPFISSDITVQSVMARLSYLFTPED